MKKFFIFSILSILFIGCSDNEINNQENIEEVKIETKQASKSVENNIDSLFYNYVNSFEYRESNRLLSIFHSKFKTAITEEDFNTTNEMLQWIDLNLDKTNFTSLEEAQTEWQPISNLLEINFNNNQELFQLIRVSDIETSIYYFEKWSVKTTTEDDHCTKRLKDCEAKARNEFIFDVVMTMGGNDALGAYADAHYIFNLRIRNCANGFEECVANL